MRRQARKTSFQAMMQKLPLCRYDTSQNLQPDQRCGRIGVYLIVLKQVDENDSTFEEETEQGVCSNVVSQQFGRYHLCKD